MRCHPNRAAPVRCHPNRARLQAEIPSFVCMSRRIRFVPPGSLVEVTCRTMQGRLLLHPSPLIADICRGILARAARLYPVDVHAFAFLSNHFHLLLSVSSARRLSEFMNYLNSNLAREVGRAIDWREKFWGRRYQEILVSDEEAAQVARLLYILRHGCKENLVRRPTDWPGATSVSALLTNQVVQGRWFDRTMEYEARRKRICLQPSDSTSMEVLRLAPLPCWKGWGAEARRTRIAELVGLVEAETERRIRDTGRLPLGQPKLLRQHPYRSPIRSKKGPAPLVHAATRAVRLSLKEAYRVFVAAFRKASKQLRQGVIGLDLVSFFPEGSFPPPSPFVGEGAPG